MEQNSFSWKLFKKIISDNSKRVKDIYIFKFKLQQTSGYININQTSYINEMKEVEISQEKWKNTFSQLIKDEAWQLWGLPGQLNSISSQTRPNVVVYNVCEVRDATLTA